ncbi:class V chitinase-like protein, partial [Penicillium cataractarum]
CGITASQFTSFNPQSSLCSSLVPGNSVCCSAESTSVSYSQQSNGAVCNTYTVKSGDYCDSIISKYAISVTELESYNSRTWGWSGCNALQSGRLICVSSGEPPMPAALAGAVCGPQVPGTQCPSNWADLESLNPCPLNDCPKLHFQLRIRLHKQAQVLLSRRKGVVLHRQGLVVRHQASILLRAPPSTQLVPLIQRVLRVKNHNPYDEQNYQRPFHCNPRSLVNPNL